MEKLIVDQILQHADVSGGGGVEASPCKTLLDLFSCDQPVLVGHAFTCLMLMKILS